MRISQDLCKSIARKLTEKSKAAIEPLEKEYSMTVTAIYESQIPAAIKKAHTAYPNWFQIDDSIKIDGHGFSRCYVDATHSVLRPGDESYAEIKLNHKIAAKIRVAKNKVDKAREAYAKLVKDTETALRNLGTTKRISDAFPDAVQYLPTLLSPGLPAVIVNMDSLKKRLASQPELEAAKDVVKS